MTSRILACIATHPTAPTATASAEDEIRQAEPPPR